MPLQNIGSIQNMNSKKLRQFTCTKGDSFYKIEEDLVGWYLIKYEAHQSSQDYLLDSLEDAFDEAEDRFEIPKKLWKEEQ